MLLSNAIGTEGALAKVNTLRAAYPGHRALVYELLEVKRALLNADGEPRLPAEEVAAVISGLKAAIAGETNKRVAAELTKLQRDLEAAIPDNHEAKRVKET